MRQYPTRLSIRPWQIMWGLMTGTGHSVLTEMLARQAEVRLELPDSISRFTEPDDARAIAAIASSVVPKTLLMFNHSR